MNEENNIADGRNDFAAWQNNIIDGRIHVVNEQNNIAGGKNDFTDQQNHFFLGKRNLIRCKRGQSGSWTKEVSSFTS